jgi:hypothetical protein
MQARNKLGRFLKGMKPWNKNKPMPLASRKKESRTKKLFYKLGITKSHRKGVKLSKKTIRKCSISQKKRLKAHPEIKKQHSIFMKKYFKAHPELVKAHREFLIELWKDPEKREKASKTAIEVYENHPNLREASRKRFIAWLIKNKDAMRYIEQGKGNKHQLSKVTLKKEKVRSLYEVMAANWLAKHEIEYFYEGKMLVFPDFKELKISFAVPDFFLPDFNCIIEIYGQYRDSRARTIKKNRAYRYYGIPFLPIRPSEINYLDTLIPKFLKQTGKNPKLPKEARSIMWGMLD